MVPEWTKNWTVYEAATILLENFSQKEELPYNTCPFNQRLSEIWEKLSYDCRLILSIQKEDF